jgi:STAS-like domain of unknown function (DUF4325)
MKKEIVKVSEVITGTSTNAEGYPLFVVMDKIIENRNIIVLSLKGCSIFSSSFLNSSIGNLLEKYGVAEMKGRLLLTDFTPVIADNIKQYIKRFKQFNRSNYMK